LFNVLSFGSVEGIQGKSPKDCEEKGASKIKMKSKGAQKHLSKRKKKKSFAKKVPRA